MFSLSLRWRLSLALAAVLTLLLALDVALTLRGAGRRIDPEVANATALTREILRDTVRDLKPSPDLDQRLGKLAASFDRLRHVRVTYRREGVEGEPAPGAQRPEPPAWFVALANPHATATTIAVEAEGRPVGAFVVAGDPGDEIAELWDSLVTLSIDGAASAALGLALVYLVVRAGLRPLERLNAGLAALSRRDYQARLGERAAPEFAPLLARFNALGASLSAAERDNLELRAKLVSIQDEERKEIARELHDEIGPYLFAARAQAGAALRAAPEGQASAAVGALIETIDALQSTNRRLLDRLRPTALEELGLAAALQALGRFFERSEPNLTVTVAVDALPALSTGLEAAIYRIAQEALTNVARHAQSDAAQLRLAREGDALALTISDRGRGLDRATGPGRGLIGMRERVAAHGGALSLSPVEPHGLCVRALFPLVSSI
jgi:two-component system, NarL family, sensor histidine kinase UhpB